MKYLIVTLFLFMSTTVLLGQTLDEVLEKHFEAVGIEHLKDVQIVQYKGYYYNRFLEKMGGDLPEKLLKPDFTLIVEKGIGYHLHIKSDPSEIITGFYNGNYWINQNGNIDKSWNPSKPDRQIIQLAIDLDGFLYNWEKKGYEAVKLKDAVINKKKYYKIQLINTEKEIIYFYLNATTYLLTYVSYDGDLADGKVHRNIEFQEYKKIEGIEIPFKRIHTELMFDGSYDKKEVIVQDVKLNPKIDKEIFNSGYKNQ